MKKKVRALGLLSGGLDSILAVKLILEQGIEVTGLSFTTPFFGPQKASQAAAMLGIALRIEDITEKHFEIVKNPPHGYGKTMNPCIDCHALMLNYAGKIMEQENYGFVFTGEVLGERPMSQNRQSLGMVAELSGYKDFIVRPLSAKLLEPTQPEIKGLVDRQSLLDISGRSRKRQIALAEEFKIREYPNPSGGCLLTDKLFSRRLQELLSFDDNPDQRQLQLLSIGRHFRLSNCAKLIVGRDMRENEVLEKFFQKENDILINPESIPGPVCILVGKDINNLAEKAARICVSYSDTEDSSECLVIIRSRTEEKKITVVTDKRDRTALRIT